MTAAHFCSLNGTARKRGLWLERDMDLNVGTRAVDWNSDIRALMSGRILVGKVPPLPSRVKGPVPSR